MNKGDVKKITLRLPLEVNEALKEISELTEVWLFLAWFSTIENSKSFNLIDDLT